MTMFRTSHFISFNPWGDYATFDDYDCKPKTFSPESLFKTASNVVKKEFSTDIIKETLPKLVVEQILENN